jgi:hypothetical protein
MKIDLNRLRGVPNARVAESIVAGILKELEDADDRAYLSDLMISESQGDYSVEPLLDRLRDDPRRIYTLFCICDAHGQPVKPGDKVKRWFKKPLYREGMPKPLREQNTSVMNGTWEQDFMKFDEYTVDNKGCISVSAADAELYFLSHFGIHGKSGARMSMHPERSGPPVTDPNTGETKKTIYWRFKEVDKQQYEKLPDLTAPTTAPTTEDNSKKK